MSASHCYFTTGTTSNVGDFDFMRCGFRGYGFGFRISGSRFRVLALKFKV
jgi:hypothetical protein